MNVDEIYMIEDAEEFEKALEEAGLKHEGGQPVIDKRFRYLYEKYRPSEEHWDYVREEMRGKR